MRPWFLIPMLLTAFGPALAQTGPRVVEVQLSSFDFTPSEIRLRAGQAVVLRLTNTSSGGHNFAAPQFFGAAHVEIELPETEEEFVLLVGRREADGRVAVIAPVADRKLTDQAIRKSAA